MIQALSEIEVAHLKLVSYFLEPAVSDVEPAGERALVTAVAIGIDPSDPSSGVESLIIFLDGGVSECDQACIADEANKVVAPLIPVFLRCGPFEGLQATPGDSIAPFDTFGYNIPPIAVGTLGAVAVAGGKQYVLSSNHVLANNGRTPVGANLFDPGPVEDATGGAVIATLTGFVPLVPPAWPLQAGSGVPTSGAAQVVAALPTVLAWPVAGGNTVDCAWAHTTSAALQPTPISQPVTPVTTNTHVFKRGRTSWDTASKIMFRRWCGYVDYGFGTYYLVDQLGTWDAARTPAFAAPGDSGSLVVLDKTRTTGVGLVTARGYQYFGGDFKGYVILICRLEWVMAALEATLKSVSLFGV